MESIQFHYKITEKDFIDYYQIHFYEEKLKSVVNKIPFLFVLSFILFLLVLIQPTIANISIMVLLVTLSLTLLVLIPLLTICFAKKVYRENQQVHHINEYFINHDKITITTNHKTSVFQWCDVNSVFESSRNIYCIFNNSQVLIIPKNKIDVNNLINSLQEALPLIKYHLKKHKQSI
ncbi:YcxB family protein [Mycoplasmatota bacterium]|nr:YcxB family protein [Mycoplasmatota bacterium]